MPHNLAGVVFSFPRAPQSRSVAAGCLRGCAPAAGGCQGCSHSRCHALSEWQEDVCPSAGFLQSVDMVCSSTWPLPDWYGPGVRQDILTVLHLVSFPQSILPLLQNSTLSTEFSDPWHLEGQELRGLFHYVSHAVLMVRQPSGTHCFGSPPPSSFCFQLIFCKV